MPRLEAVKISSEVGFVESVITPRITCDIVEASADDVDDMFTKCTAVTLTYDPYKDPASGEVDEEREVITVSCCSAEESMGFFVRKSTLLQVRISSPKPLSVQFQKELGELGFWWLYVRFNEQEQSLSFTVNSAGAVLAGNLISAGGDVLRKRCFESLN